MYRTVRKLSGRPLLAATFAVPALLVHADEPKTKLSIYPSPSTDVVLVDSPSELEKRIGNVRRRGQLSYSNTHSTVQGWVSKCIGVEHAVENRIKSIIAPDEALTPGVLYIGVATLSGSILSRNRMLPTRFLLPPLFLVLSAQHFLPKATHNLSNYLGDVEDEYFPTFAQKHDTAKAHGSMAWTRVKDVTGGFKTQIENGTMVAIDKIQLVSGLKIREIIGRQKALKAKKDEQTNET